MAIITCIYHFLASLSCLLSLARSGAFFNLKQKEAKPGEVPDEIISGLSSHATRCLPLKVSWAPGPGWPPGLPFGTGKPTTADMSTKLPWFLGWRNCWPQEHLGYQEPKKGPGDDEQTDPVGLHRL